MIKLIAVVLSIKITKAQRRVIEYDSRKADHGLQKDGPLPLSLSIL